MAYELGFWPRADEVLAMLEGDRKMSSVLAAVTRTLDRLEQDPYERRLGTRSFVSKELGGVNATPARVDNWYVLWQFGSDPGSIEIILIHSIDL